MSQQALKNFVAVRVDEAVYADSQGAENILVELRFKADRSCLLFTRIRGENVYSRSIEHFVLEQPDCLSLTFTRAIRVLWEGVFKNSQIVESYLPNRDVSSVDVNVIFRVDGKEYDSGKSTSLTEAMFEIHDLVDPKVTWWLEACWHCKFSYSAFLGPSNDRDESRCYRDAPEAFAEVQQKHKFASFEALYAGAYYVTAFHRCAAWQAPKQDQTI